MLKSQKFKSLMQSFKNFGCWKNYTILAKMEVHCREKADVDSSVDDFFEMVKPFGTPDTWLVVFYSTCILVIPKCLHTSHLICSIDVYNTSHLICSIDVYNSMILRLAFFLLSLDALILFFQSTKGTFRALFFSLCVYIYLQAQTILE